MQAVGIHNQPSLPVNLVAWPSCNPVTRVSELLSTPLLIIATKFNNALLRVSNVVGMEEMGGEGDSGFMKWEAYWGLVG